MLARSNLRWEKCDSGLSLHRGLAADPLLHVVPDAEHPGLWHIRFRGGYLSDFTNLTRAKDAAQSLALADLNAHEGQERPLGGAPIAPEDEGDAPGPEPSHRDAVTV